MAHLWRKTTDGWEARTLAKKVYDLDSLFAQRAGEAKPGVAGAEEGRGLLTVLEGSRTWVLAASPGAEIRVNGRVPLAGLAVLCDRDEIRLGDGVQYFFSSEDLARIEEFPAQDRTTHCGRCHLPIKAGSPAVRCPNCGIWYNQSAEYPCWTYSDKCAYCGHPTSLEAGFSWVPEE
jgi:predicted RNA-binding Zn-ribbon protein involved in translation (DUF1610 family)